MSTNPTTAYWEFVQKALEGGMIEVRTIDHARKIIYTLEEPRAIKILREFDGIHRSAYLAFCVEAERQGMWVICGEATFLEKITDN